MTAPRKPAKPARRTSRKSSKKTARKTSTEKPSPRGSTGDAARRAIDRRIAELDDWRGAKLAAVRRLVHAADPEVVEEVKWGGVPVWSHAGILCTGETYESVVKLTFAHGASLPDPARLFNASLEGATRRAIDLREADELDPRAFRALIRAAVARNLAAQPARRTKSTT